MTALVIGELDITNTTAAILQGIGSLAQAGATLVAGILVYRAAISTFQSWRDQKIDERKLELAIDVLMKCYSARRALNRVLFLDFFRVTQSNTELNSDPNFASLQDRNKHRQVMGRVYRRNLEEILPLRDALDYLLPQALVIFGKELEDAINAVIQIFNHVSGEISSATMNTDNNGERVEQDVERQFKEFFETDTDARMKAMVSVEIAKVEAVCLRVLRQDVSVKDSLALKLAMGRKAMPR